MKVISKPIWFKGPKKPFSNLCKWGFKMGSFWYDNSEQALMNETARVHKCWQLAEKNHESI